MANSGGRMKKLSVLLSGLSLSIVMAGHAMAAPFILNGQVAQHNVEELTTEIPWTTTLQQAEMEARSEGKMIFWMHMLGSLSGAT